MKNIDERGVIQADRLDRICPFPRYDKYLLRQGDVLVLSRGTRNTASLVPSEFPVAIAASYFTIIRVRDDIILPEYLAIFLNHSKTQNRIREMVRGTTLPTESLNNLGKLLVSVPSLERQRLLVELDHQCRHAEKLEETIQAKRRELVEREMGRLV